MGVDIYEAIGDVTYVHDRLDFIHDDNLSAEEKVTAYEDMVSDVIRWADIRTSDLMSRIPDRKNRETDDDFDKFEDLRIGKEKK